MSNYINAKMKVFSQSDKSDYIMEFGNILYVESHEKVCSIHYTIKGEHFFTYVNLLLKDVETLLSSNDFYRCHKSFIVNLHQVLDYGKYPKKVLNLIMGLEIPLSRRRKLDFHLSYLKLHKSIA